MLFYVNDTEVYTDDCGAALYVDAESSDFIDWDGVIPYVDEIFSALYEDDCDEFVRVVKHEQSVGALRKKGYVIAPSLMLSWTIYERALRCAEAILSGATGQSVNINAAASGAEIPPIHIAVTCFLPDVVDLLLKYGARLDVLCKNHRTCYYFMQPLDACLEALRTKINIQWTPDQSVYKLILALSGSPELEQALCTLSCIMRALPSEETQKAIYYRAAEGKLFELTVLLYVDAISELGILKCLSKVQYLPLRHSVATYFSSLSVEEIQSMAGCDGNYVSIDKERVLGSMMLLFEIFRRTNFSMLGFGTMPQILEKRINDAGFHLNDQHNLVDMHAEIQVGHRLKPMVDLPVGGFGTMPRLRRTTGSFVPGSAIMLRRSISSAGQTYQTPLNSKFRLATPTLCTPKGSILRRKWAVLPSAIRRITRV